MPLKIQLLSQLLLLHLTFASISEEDCFFSKCLMLSQKWLNFSQRQELSRMLGTNLLLAITFSLIQQAKWLTSKSQLTSLFSQSERASSRTCTQWVNWLAFPMVIYSITLTMSIIRLDLSSQMNSTILWREAVAGSPFLESAHLPDLTRSVHMATSL